MAQRKTSLRQGSRKKDKKSPRLESPSDLKRFASRELTKIFPAIVKNEFRRFSENLGPFALSSGGRFGKLPNNLTNSIIRLRSIAEGRKFTNKLIDKNLSISTRLLRAEAKARKGGKTANINETLGKLDEGTLKFFDKLKKLKVKAQKESVKFVSEVETEAFRRVQKAQGITGNSKLDAMTKIVGNRSLPNIRKGVLKETRMELRKNPSSDFFDIFE